MELLLIADKPSPPERWLVRAEKFQAERRACILVCMINARLHGKQEAGNSRHFPALTESNLVPSLPGLTDCMPLKQVLSGRTQRLSALALAESFAWTY